MAQTPPPAPRSGRRIATQALAATGGLYGLYAVLGLVGLHPDLRYLVLVGAFYFLPQWMLRRDEERQARYQVGPGPVVPPWEWRGARVAGLMALVVFPPFVLAFFWFYQQVCSGDLSLLSPVIGLESLTPAEGGLQTYLTRLCRAHGGGFWPDAIRLPGDWLKYGGLGVLLAVAVEVFAIALPEELFHRGYLMSALEELWPPKLRILGAKLGLGAVVASALFAVGHLVGMAEVSRLATFFPSLVFSWLWRRSGTLWAPALFHAASNLLMAILLASTFPR